MLMITLYAEQKKRHRCIEQSFSILIVLSVVNLHFKDQFVPTSLGQFLEL